MKKKLSIPILIIGICLLICKHSKSQSIISGVVKDTNDKPLQFANILLLKSADSSLVKGTVSNALGQYSFGNIGIGKYLITASFTGMNQVFTKIFEVTQNQTYINPEILYLRNVDVQLKDITVTVKKPLYEQKIDRMVINVKNSITDVSGSALDILEKSPGVAVNRQNSIITINGKNGVTVMLNGKINHMPMDALVQLLTATSANNIDKIELITAPPSKYDAEGNAGYINIVLSSNPDAGFSGSYFLTGGYGKKELGATGLDFNYRTRKLNLYGNYSFKYDHYIQPSTGFTAFTKNGNIITNTSFSNRDAIRTVQNVRIGVDYQLDTSTIIGAMIGGYISHWSMTADNGATISKNNQPDTTVNAYNSEVNHWQSLMTNLNFQHTFKPGKVLYLDANYASYKDDNPNTYSNTYYNTAMQFLSHENLQSGKITPISFKVLSADYTTPITGKITMELGTKISLSRFTNDVGVSKLKEGIWIPDAELSANYLLKENIGAAYTSFNMTLNGKISLKAGVRYEYTTSNLGTTKTPDIVDRKYGELFPAFFITKKLSNDRTLSFSYNRRITRPAFTDLAPFTIFFDPKTFFNGNPALQPAIVNAVQANYGFKNYLFSLGYSYEQNTIENFYFQTQRLDTTSNILYLSASNFKYEQYLTSGFSLPFTINKWWNMQNNITGSWRQVNTSYENKPVRLEIFDYRLNSTQHFILPANLSFEITGFYYSAGYLGTAKFKPTYQLNLGLQKKINNTKDIFRLTANDIFNSGGYVSLVDNLPVKGSIVRRSFNYGNVGYKITYTHNFGNKALKGKRDRSTGAEEELNRVNN